MLTALSQTQLAVEAVHDVLRPATIYPGYRGLLQFVQKRKKNTIALV